MASIPKEKIPAFVRRCWEQFKKANVTTRQNEVERLRCYVGGDLMWMDAEVEKRRSQNRPIVTINRCKPAVDQVEGDVRLNPPGPECKPVGDNHEDACDPDIIEGLIREVEYRSMSEVADSTAVKYCASTGLGYIELSTEYANERDDQQQLRIDSVEDPAVVFFDPASRMANRQDAMWAGKVKSYTRDQYEMTFGKNRKVLQPGGVQMARGWLAEAFGLGDDALTMNAWTGAREDGEGRWRGPFLVAEFYLVEVEERYSRLYTNGVWYIDGETVPEGVEPRKNTKGSDADYKRPSPRRKICKYIVDALEAQDDTEWLGSLIPIFPVLGPEVYIDGKLHRLSLISGAIDSNRALNYVATTAAELTGLLPKSPYIGYEGQFDSPKWDSVNSEVWAYMEVKPTFASDEQGQEHLLPMPQRNMWEAPIQWLMQLGQWYADNIKATTATYDASLGANKGDQSGKAIEQLRSESNVGNYSYADNLHRTKTIIYQQMCEIFPKIMTGQQAAIIVRPDNQHEVIRINQLFPGGIDPATGKKGKANNIALGKYSVRAVAGPKYLDREDEAIRAVIEAGKLNPAIFQNPAVMARVIRWIGAGNPTVEGIADLISPQQGDEVTPEQISQQNQQLQMQVKTLMQALQAAQMEKAGKTLELKAKDIINIRDNTTKLAIGEMTAKTQDAARASADTLAMMEMAHEVGKQAADHEQATAQQQADQEHQQTMPAVQAAAQPEPEPSGETQ